MDRSAVEAWIQAYRKAWQTDDEADVAALFTEDATYKPYPWRREAIGWQGRDEIVRQWVERGDSKVGWRFEHEILAVEGDTAVIEGWTSYDRGDGEPWAEAYANIWLVRFGDDGRARQFKEWWVEKPKEVG
ncbi:MAG TPA: nuclear transport factor 2 family protein [Candidatus Limnocylindrales bacterium]|nr:nuclear transport factor 2 family protein [Candidatus Limnocylindrales bacterium]